MPFLYSEPHPDVAWLHEAGYALPIPGLLTTLSRSVIVDYPFRWFWCVTPEPVGASGVFYRWIQGGGQTGICGR